jgi:phosphotransferase system HPr (HPr) family protein
MPQIQLDIDNEVGLHARPAALFVQTASKFQSSITVQNGGNRADAKSILEVLTLGAGKGASIVISAEGEDAAQALKALQELIAGHFGEGA